MLNIKWDIIGHQAQLSRLEKEIKQANLAHAYLFSGPKHVGKFNIAKKIATILQCEHAGCNQCKSCELSAKGIHPDIITIDDNGESIKISEMRALIEKVNLTHHSKYRIVLIKNIERMPIEAQNAFLKTLEEPSKDTIFILTTHQLGQILPTIYSRVRHYSFYGLSDSMVASLIKSKDFSPNQMDEILHFAHGLPGLAVRLSENSDFLQTNQEFYGKVKSFLKRNDLANKFMFVESIEKDRESVELFLEVFGRHLRSLILSFDNAPSALQARFSLKDLVNLFDILEEIRYLIGRNINRKLALENLLIATEK